jgi:glycosyltransferase involved in cell wall biosynthesis
MARVAVAMIVRNEAGRIGRALTSVRESVDSWLLIDTGSSDSTIQEIRAATDGWPGILLKRPWTDFGANRTELVQIARENRSADWLLTIDADHVVEEASEIRSAVARAETNNINALYIQFTSLPIVWTLRLIRADLPWSYVGATREALVCAEQIIPCKSEVPKIRDFADGASRENKWHRDVDLLRLELAASPENSRSWYGLGDSYRGLRQFELAAIAFTNCAIKTRSTEERYVALTLSGEMFLAYGHTDEGLARLLLANSERPHRREALLMACQVLNQLGKHDDVLDLLGKGPAQRPIPVNDLLAIIPEAYGAAMAQEQMLARNAVGGSTP